MRLKSLLISSALLSGLSVAQAADLPVEVPKISGFGSSFDLAFGAAIATDYNFRGISQSDRGVSGKAYFEGRYDWLYAGVAAYSVDLPTQPAAEVDFYAGLRPTFGALALDLGFTYYYYPNETQLITAGPVIWTPADSDFWEFYGKGIYTFNDTFSLGANVFYAPDWLNTGAQGTYASLTGNINLPYNFALSGEIGRYWLGTTDAFLGGVDLPDYTYWNVGISYTFNSTVKFDVRYHDTDLSDTQCMTITSDPSGTGSGVSNWCGSAIIATVSFDTSLGALSK